MGPSLPDLVLQPKISRESSLGALPVFPVLRHLSVLFLLRYVAIFSCVLLIYPVGEFPLLPWENEFC